MSINTVANENAATSWQSRLIPSTATKKNVKWNIFKWYLLGGLFVSGFMLAPKWRGDALTSTCGCFASTKRMKKLPTNQRRRDTYINPRRTFSSSLPHTQALCFWTPFTSQKLNLAMVREASSRFLCFRSSLLPNFRTLCCSFFALSPLNLLFGLFSSF